MHTQLMMGMRPNMTNNANRFSAPTNMQQRSGMQNVRQQWPGNVNSTPNQQQPNSQVPTSSTNGSASASLRAQQAKQRREVLVHAQSFLNPYKKPVSKLGNELDSAPQTPASPTNQPHSKDEHEATNDQIENKTETK